MARKVTPSDIKQFNELYYQHKSYAKVALITGWSSSTVSKYIDKNYKPIAPTNIRKFNLDTDMPEFSLGLFQGMSNLGDLCVLTEDEKKEITELWEEIAI